MLAGSVTVTGLGIMTGAGVIGEIDIFITLKSIVKKATTQNLLHATSYFDINIKF
jgi:hypothetical protein